MTPAAAAAVVAALSCGVALLATPVVRRLALRAGFVARPSANRWHQHSTALLGGIAIAVATTLGVLGWFLLGSLGANAAGAAPVGLAFAMVGLCALFMFGVGLIDDLIELSPQLKFSLQLLCGVALVAAGATLTLTPWHLVNVLASLFWFVALTNACNLLDNMDGVAAGVAAIAATFLGFTFALQGAWLHAAAAWALAGAALGFLRYNFAPARIFMGDAGSLFIGSLLAGLVLTSPASVSGNLVAVLFVPLAIMAVPVVDTALVTITRMLASRAISQGGRDHSTHRLVALGLRERQVALLLYGFAVLGGAVGLALTQLDFALGVMLGTIFLVALTLSAAYLGRLEMRYPDEPAGWQPVTVLATELMYKQRLAAMMLDVALVAVAYYGAFRLRFGGDGSEGARAMMEAYQFTLWIVIAVKVIVFGFFGLYRGAWRYTSMIDGFRILGAIAASAAVLTAFAWWRMPALAASNVLWIDAMLSGALVLAVRLSFRTLELARAQLRRRGDRVAIYGAGDAGELVVRTLLNKAELDMHPVCLLDDDVRKHRGLIHGLPVLGGLDRLDLAVARYGVRRILIATRNLRGEVMDKLLAFAAAHDVELLELEVGFRPLDARGAGSTLDLVAEQPAVRIRGAAVQGAQLRP